MCIYFCGNNYYALQEWTTCMYSALSEPHACILHAVFESRLNILNKKYFCVFWQYTNLFSNQHILRMFVNCDIWIWYRSYTWTRILDCLLIMPPWMLQSTSIMFHPMDKKLGSNPGQGSKGINFSGWHGLYMSITVTKRR